MGFQLDLFSSRPELPPGFRRSWLAAHVEPIAGSHAAVPMALESALCRVLRGLPATPSENLLPFIEDSRTLLRNSSESCPVPSRETDG